MAGEDSVEDRESDTKKTFRIIVKTGNRFFAGTSSNVWIRLNSSEDRTHEIYLGSIFNRGKDHTVTTSASLIDVFEIELWRERKTYFDDKWFLEKVSIIYDGKTVEFPVEKWITEKYHYIIGLYDTSLPHKDHQAKRHLRLEELKIKQSSYQFKQNFLCGPVQIAAQPADENFNIISLFAFEINKKDVEYKWKTNPFQNEWASMDDIKQFYNHFEDLETEVKNWSDDAHFARQRLSGVNPTLLELCTEEPTKLNLGDVDKRVLCILMNGMTLEVAINKRRLFIVDLEILKDTPVKPGFVLPCPIALFYEDEDDQLQPLAIQLFQNENSPVFLRDNNDTWLLAKMWYNLADATYHQSLTHLGFTHLIMEGFVITTHRQLSTSHPIFKLLAPHFLDLIAINTLALGTLLSPNGWVETVTTIGVDGMQQLIAKGLKSWRLDIHGTLPEDLKRRGLYDTGVLKGYYFRDDALLLYNAIKDYVSKYIELYYGKEDEHMRLANDREIHNWGNELTKSVEAGGCGIKGIPHDGEFKKLEDLIVTLTSIIYTCSVAHAAVNFPQYVQYAFPPNYPLCLNGIPPNVVNAHGRKDIFMALPDKTKSLDTMTIAKVLSQPGTKSLGDFEKQYIYDPDAIKIVKSFRQKLDEISKEIGKKNDYEREHPYNWLDPVNIPNSISI